MKFNVKEITDFLDRYLKVQDWFNKCNVKTDTDFQEAYMSLYHFNDEQRKLSDLYFDLLERSKSENIDFKYVLTALYDKYHVIEPSITSKLLATRNPYYPLWDDYIFKSLGLEQPREVLSNDRKIEESVKIYNLMLKKLQEDMRCQSTTYMIDEFNHTFPNYIDLTPTKKLDMVLWTMRDVTVIDLYKEIILLTEGKHED